MFFSDVSAKPLILADSDLSLPIIFYKVLDLQETVDTVLPLKFEQKYL